MYINIGTHYIIIVKCLALYYAIIDTAFIPANIS